MKAYRHRRLGASLCLAAVVAVGGCADDANKNTPADLSVGANFDLTPLPICTAGAKDCVNDRLARVCASDGLSWTPVQCDFGQKCSAGDCVIDNSVCTPGDDTCMGNTALRCMSNGMGYTMTACPAKTVCRGPGVCVGSCVVGSTICADPNTILTCADGFTFTQTSTCSGTTHCVQTSHSSVQDFEATTAACVAGDCTPDPDGCNTVCGNQNDSAADQTKFTSTCQATPLGWRWNVQQCTGSTLCVPNSSGCGAIGKKNASCAAACTQGDQICVTDSLRQSVVGSTTPLAFRTCGADGTYGPPQSCNSDPNNVSLGCMIDPAKSNRTLCADFACTIAGGTCDGTDKLRTCGTDGRLVPAANATACPAGSYCQVVTGNIPPQFQGGKCASDCINGEKRCNGTHIVQTCVGGVFTNDTICSDDAGTQTCRDFISYNTTLGFVNFRNAVCGECTPGVAACGKIDAPDASSLLDGVRTCNASGHYDPIVKCSQGECQDKVGCVVTCVPGEPYCSGTVKYVQGTNKVIVGTDTGTICPPNGIREDGSGCPGPNCCQGDLVCRKNFGGSGVNVDGHGCVQCLGNQLNEFGLIDSRCTDSNGGFSGPQNSIEVCQPNNTWGPPTICNQPTTCVPPTPTIPGYFFTPSTPPNPATCG
jgi:hypothetical protein